MGMRGTLAWFDFFFSFLSQVGNCDVLYFRMSNTQTLCVTLIIKLTYDPRQNSHPMSQYFPTQLGKQRLTADGKTGHKSGLQEQLHCLMLVSQKLFFTKYKTLVCYWISVAGKGTSGDEYLPQMWYVTRWKTRLSIKYSGICKIRPGGLGINDIPLWFRRKIPPN